MQSGLKNLQSAARACARRERLEGTGGPSGSGSSLLPVQHHAHDPHGAYGDPHSADDSGIGLDELEAEYQSAGGDSQSYGGQSASLSPDDGAHEPSSRGGPVKLYPTPVGRAGLGGGGGAYDARGDGGMYGGGGGAQQMMGARDMGGRDRGYGPQGGQMQQRPQYGLQQRLPSIDMGIGAIINRPPGSR
jgi:hypothetical protein